MPIQPLSATLLTDGVADPGGGPPRGVATVAPLDDAGAIAALRDWHAHLAAGRLADAAPPAPGRPAREARLRATERALGIRRGAIG